MLQCSRCAIWIFLSRACTSCGKVLRFMWQGRDILILDRASRQMVCTYGNASHVTCAAFSNAVFGSFCRIPRYTYSIFLLRTCVCELNSEHVYPPHNCDLYFSFGSFRLALKPPVQVKMFPNEIKLPVSEHVLRGADLRVHAYYASSSGFANVCHRLS